MNKLPIALVATFAVAFIGCSYSKNMGHFSMVTTDENVDWSRKNEFMLSYENVSGEHIIRNIVFVTSGANQPEFEKATKQALSKVSGAVALVDVDFKTSWLHAPFYFHSKYTVTGKVLIDSARVNQK